MSRFLIRRKLNGVWNYLMNDGSCSVDLLEAAKFRTIEDLVRFVLEKNLEVTNSIIEEVKFSITAEPSEIFN